MDRIIHALSDIAESSPFAIWGPVDVRQFRSPIVYAWIRGESLLYIGQSAVGIARPIDARHEHLGGEPWTEVDRLAIWRMPTAQAACHIEELTIEALRPQRSRPCRT